MGILRHQSSLYQQGDDEQTSGVDPSHGKQTPDDSQSAHEHRPHEGWSEADEQEVCGHADEGEQEADAPAEKWNAQSRTQEKEKAEMHSRERQEVYRPASAKEDEELLALRTPYTQQQRGEKSRGGVPRAA